MPDTIVVDLLGIIEIDVVSSIVDGVACWVAVVKFNTFIRVVDLTTVADVMLIEEEVRLAVFWFVMTEEGWVASGIDSVPLVLTSLPVVVWEFVIVDNTSVTEEKGSVTVVIVSVMVDTGSVNVEEGILTVEIASVIVTTGSLSVDMVSVTVELAPMRVVVDFSLTDWVEE